MNETLTQPAGGTVTVVPRLGFLGIGWIGRNRMEAIAQSGAGRVVAVADPALEVIESDHLLPREATVARSLEDLLAMDLDGIVIATPSALHADQAVTVLEHGLAVFCQKPLARTAAETRRVVDAARAADRLLGVDLSYRHLRGVPELREMIRGGALGDVFAADLVFHNAYGPDKPWFYDPALSGGGCVIDLGIHLVDLALWLLDAPQVTHVTSALYAKGRRLEPAQSLVNEDYAVATLELATGASVRIACSWNLPAGQDAQIEAVFYGTAGGGALRNVAGSFFDFTVERLHGTTREVISAPPDSWGGRAAVSWARHLAAGGRFDHQADHLVEVATILDRIYGR